MGLAALHKGQAVAVLQGVHTAWVAAQGASTADRTVPQIREDSATGFSEQESGWHAVAPGYCFDSPRSFFLKSKVGRVLQLFLERKTRMKCPPYHGKCSPQGKEGQVP